MAFTYSTATTASGFTQATLGADINTAMLAIGYTLHDSYSSGGSDYYVHKYIINGLTKGTVYTVTQISATTVFSSLYDTWNAGTHTGTGASTGASVTWSNVSSVVLHKFNGAEGKLMMLINGANKLFLGYVRPSSLYSQISENTYRMAVQIASAGFTSAYGSTSVASSFAFSTSGVVSLGQLAIDSNKYQVYSRKFMYSTTSGIGIVGFFADIVDVGASGLTVGDVLQVSAGTEEYILVANSGGFVALRSL